MITRRAFLRQSALTLGGLRAASAFPPGADEPVTVKTPLGSVRGRSADGVSMYFGIPFAAPPTGALRFKPPARVQPWTGVLDATHFAPAAPQPGEGAYPKSEDCLHLNVWTPASGSGPFPVFVWIHGGGFTGGRSSDATANGAKFASAGIVCVTIAYRLGVLGFLDMEPLLGPDYAGSANNGMQDVVAALEWVKANVSSFGGDPDRVTVGGESAGAKITDMLLGVPSAKTLFHQAISESGGAERIWPRGQALSVGRGFGEAWTAQTGRPPAAAVDAPVGLLIRAQEQFLHDWPVHFPLRPELDGAFFPQDPVAAMRKGSVAGKHVLIGTNRDESAFFIGPDPARDPGPHDLGNMSVEQFRPIEDAYAKRFPELPASLRRIRSLTAEEYLIPSLRVTDACVAGGATAFAYRLDFPGEGRFAGLAFHSYDLRFVWEHFEAGSVPQAAQQLADAMHGAWISFIHGKPPEAPGLPAWPPYTLNTRKTMLLNAQSRIEDDPFHAEAGLWSGFLK